MGRPTSKWGGVLDGTFGMPSYGEFILVNESISTLKGSVGARRRMSDQERQKREQDTLLKGSNVFLTVGQWKNILPDE
jgi:hypothetical protein